MRSLFAKILIWFAVTLVVCMLEAVYTNSIHNRPGPDRHDFMSRSLSLQLSEATHAYEAGGKSALNAYFSRLGSFMPGAHALLNADGIDLVTGKNRSAELPRLGSRWDPLERGRNLMVWPSTDGKYKLVIHSDHLIGPPSAIPFSLWIFVATVAFSYILAVHIASPLRELEQTVERFGSGDLAIRASTGRGDEIGKLARAFNLMAARIEGLLTAERRLLQDVSHELRSPLARLKFAVELARTDPDSESALNRVYKEVDRLSELVSELLQVTRVESDRKLRKEDKIWFPDLLTELIEDNRIEAEARGTSLHLVSGERACIQGDRELLRRAVENVLRNAVRYAPFGSPVDISVARKTSGLLIAIRDYGPGAPESTLANLFKPFFRVESDRNRGGGGVGLGLAIAQRAVAVHDGTIRAANAQPGLIVEIEVPAAVSMSQAEVARV